MSLVDATNAEAEIPDASAPAVEEPSRLQRMYDRSLLASLLQRAYRGIVPQPAWYNPQARTGPTEIVSPDFRADAVVPPERNPARMTAGVEHAAQELTTQPLWEMAQGVGALASGAGITPEVGGGLMAGLGSLSPAIFAGPMARTANRAMLSRAEQMAAQGADRTRIWNETGWFTGVDGKWRFEIPDNNARLTGRQEHVVSENIQHPELYEAYPDLRTIRMGYSEPQRSAAYYSPDGRLERIGISGIAPPRSPSTYLHELQHAVQQREGFAKGTSPETIEPVAQLVAGPGVSPDIIREAYRRHAGEVEARNVQARSIMSQDTRETTPPWATQDRPDDVQTVVGATRGPQGLVFQEGIPALVHKYGLAGITMLPPATAAYLQEHLIPVDHDPFDETAIPENAREMQSSTPLPDDYIRHGRTLEPALETPTPRGGTTPITTRLVRAPARPDTDTRDQPGGGGW